MESRSTVLVILAGPLERTLDTLDSVIRDLPFFSVIIPTYNRRESLCRCLNALSRLDYPSAAFEALIVDDGGLESIESIVEPWRDRLLIHVLKRTNGGPGTARNMGAAAACGDFLVFLDDDCTPRPEWLRAFAAVAEDRSE